jgi:biopolymer transport protein ExbD
MEGQVMRRSYRLRSILQNADAEVDLVPLIDCVFLMLLFFLLCGHLSMTSRVEQITVPPARTAQTILLPDQWHHEVINVGGGRSDDPVRLRIGQVLDTAGLASEESLARLRSMLDRIHMMNATYVDPVSGMTLPQVVVELRVDAEVPWRAVQEVEQVLADCIEPKTGLPKAGMRRPFPMLMFSVRDPTDG